MTHPDKVYHERVIRLCEIAGEEGVLDGFEFTDCHINGPAVVVIQGHSTLSNNKIEGDIDAVLWEVSPSRPVVIGAILANDCTFEGCTFTNVGFAGPSEFTAMFRGGAQTG